MSCCTIVDFITNNYSVCVIMYTGSTHNVRACVKIVNMRVCVHLNMYNVNVH